MGIQLVNEEYIHIAATRRSSNYTVLMLSFSLRLSSVVRRTGASTLDHARSVKQNIIARNNQFRTLVSLGHGQTTPYSIATIRKSSLFRSLHSSGISHNSPNEESITKRSDSDPTLSFAALSTCQISDALVTLKVTHGGHIPDVLPISLPSPNTRICGPAYTVQLVPESDNDSPKLITKVHWIDTIPAGSVVVVAAPTEAKDAVWGSLMSAAAQERSLKGVVISGRTRDVGGHRALGFPVFARATSTLGPTFFTRASQVDIPLTIKPQFSHHETNFPSITVNPGDWIIADGDGVVCVPRGLEQKVIAMAEEGVKIDELCNAEIKAEGGFQKAFVRFAAKFEI